MVSQGQVRCSEPEDVLSILAGLLPLVSSGDGSDTAAISRDHTIIVSNSGLITVTGGKWTTYRKMAEDVIDYAEMIGGIGVKRCVTQDLMIHGSATVLDPGDPLAVYGSDAAEIRTLAAEKRAQRQANDALLAELADSIRAGGPALGDPVAADEVRRTGWARPA